MKKIKEINDFIVRSIEKHPKDVTRLAAERFNLNRRTIVDHLQGLIADGILAAEGRTKARVYKLRTLIEESWTLPITPDSEEQQVWETTVAPQLVGIPDNVRAICQYGFNEMFNNAIDHSNSSDVRVDLKTTGASINIRIHDFGIGIFEKIKTALNLAEPREALLELSKGKLTTAPERHAGEGIFFTSRMFEKFSILSGELVYLAQASTEDDWLFEYADGKSISGTAVNMNISTQSARTTQSVFDRFSGVDVGFTKTHVPVALARHGEDKLVSRSQARRVLARFDKFKEVSLDFSGVATIGQPFADEIFRVFADQNPNIKLTHSHASLQIQNMIAWVRGARGTQGSLL
jgi:anti-sigma regulatory factor (Ser/Thr protein kinase)